MVSEMPDSTAIETRKENINRLIKNFIDSIFRNQVGIKKNQEPTYIKD
jgi:hypothetical protein